MNIQPKALKRIYYREFFNFSPPAQIRLDKAQWLPSIFDGPHSSIIEKGKEITKSILKLKTKN
jgi:hypothetical protein